MKQTRWRVGQPSLFNRARSYLRFQCGCVSINLDRTVLTVNCNFLGAGMGPLFMMTIEWAAWGMVPLCVGVAGSDFRKPALQGGVSSKEMSGNRGIRGGGVPDVQMGLMEGPRASDPSGSVAAEVVGASSLCWMVVAILNSGKCGGNAPRQQHEWISHACHRKDFLKDGISFLSHSHTPFLMLFSQFDPMIIISLGQTLHFMIWLALQLNLDLIVVLQTFECGVITRIFFCLCTLLPMKEEGRWGDQQWNWFTEAVFPFFRLARASSNERGDLPSIFPILESPHLQKWKVAFVFGINSEETGQNKHPLEACLQIPFSNSFCEQYHHGRSFPLIFGPVKVIKSILAFPHTLVDAIWANYLSDISLNRRVSKSGSSWSDVQSYFGKSHSKDGFSTISF